MCLYYVIFTFEPYFSHCLPLLNKVLPKTAPKIRIFGSPNPFAASHFLQVVDLSCRRVSHTTLAM